MSDNGPVGMDLDDGRDVKPEPQSPVEAAEESESRAEGEGEEQPNEAAGDDDDDDEGEQVEGRPHTQPADGASQADDDDGAARWAKEQRRTKSLRRNYRTMEETINKPEYAALAAINPKVLHNTIAKMDQWHSNIGQKDVSTSVIDAKLLTKASKFGVMQARALQQTVRINWKEVEEKIVERFPLGARGTKSRRGRGAAASADAGSEDDAVDLADDSQRRSIDWHKFARAAAHRIACVTPTSFMKGILGIQFVAKAKKARAARKADEDDERAPRTGATHQTDPSKEASTMTDMRVAALLQALPLKENALCFFDILFHPTSFTQTVENLFDLTFLVRKGQAVIQLDPDLGVPYLWKVDDTDAAARANQDDEDDAAAAGGGGGSGRDRNGQSKNFQCIFAIDEERYRKIIDVYGINKRSKPFLKDRANDYAQIKQREARAAGGSGSKRKQPAAATDAAAAAGAASAAASSASPSRARGVASTPATGSRASRGSHSIAAMFSPSQPTLGMFTNAHLVDEEGDLDEEDDTPPSTPRAADTQASAAKRQRRGVEGEQADNDDNGDRAAAAAAAADLSEGEVDGEEEAAMSQAQPAHKPTHKKR